MSARILVGDALEQLRELDAWSVDALVTDPPAGISFMGATWDDPSKYGFSDGADRLGAPPTVNLGRNATCQKCGGRQRAGAKTKGCSCETPAFNDRALRLRDRAAFIATMVPIFEEALRVLKPGAHALVWALPRTSHWTASAVEDAGFAIRDVGVHLFAQGFPKSRNLHGSWEGSRSCFDRSQATSAAKRHRSSGQAPRRLVDRRRPKADPRSGTRRC